MTVEGSGASCRAILGMSKDVGEILDYHKGDNEFTEGHAWMEGSIGFEDLEPTLEGNKEHILGEK